MILILSTLLSACNASPNASDKTSAEQSQSQVQSQSQSQDPDTLEQIHKINRESYKSMKLKEWPIYVIGHKSPDSDTVISAIVYAKFLTLLGYEAKPAITEPVNQETEFLLKEAGVEMPDVLENAAGKNIFLIDHSEYTQAAEGMKDANVVGILDHHGVGGVTTGDQLVYEARPMGAGATIVWMDYMNCGFEIDRSTATLLLGAILSDTTNLTGTTVNETDRLAVDYLAKLAGKEDVKAFYREIREKALSYEGMSNSQILYSDYKEYQIAGISVGIGLINTIDEDASKKMAERMKEAMAEAAKTKKVNLLYASVGIREDGVKIDYIIPCDETSEKALKSAFPNYDEFDGTSYIFRKGLGRKTKFVPGLTEYFNSTGGVN